MKRLSLLFISVLLLFTACSPNKKSDYLTLNLEEAIKLTNSDLILNDISSGYRVIPLETNNSCLLSDPSIKYVSDSDIWIKDNQAIYRFDKKSGCLLFKLDKKGQGPEEYLSISDFVIDYKTQTISIYNLNGKKLLMYNFDGKYLNLFDNDFIGSFDLIDETYFLVSYNPFSEKPFHIGIYDKSWNELNQFMPKTEAFNQKEGLVHFDMLCKFNEKHYTKKPFNDTLYQVDKEQAKPYLILSEGNLRIPAQVATDLSKKKDRSRYIFGEFGYMILKYYFSSYYYQNKRYQDVWNLETSSLVYRKIAQEPEDKQGVPFVIQGETIFVWPKFVYDDYLYCVVPAENMQKIIPGMQEDDNPVIIEIKID
jgi:hypothetical protein